MVRLNPKLAPEDINIKLFGPGVMEDTRENITSPSNTSILIYLLAGALRFIQLLKKIQHHATI